MIAMRYSRTLLLAMPGLLFLAIGCAQVQTRQYQVTVDNQSSKPVTVWLTKNGEFYEDTWKAPEDWAIESPHAKDPVAGVVVPSHEKRGTDVLTGKFRPETDAILRVYDGQLTFNEILAAGKSTGGRKDVVLKPGSNDVTVTDTGIKQAFSPLPAKK
jgi:hypothetical protein